MHRFRNPNRFKTDNRDNLDGRPICRYGASCYQKNPHHLQRFKHPDVPVVKKTTWTNSSNKRKINNDGKNQAAKKAKAGTDKPKTDNESNTLDQAPGIMDGDEAVDCNEPIEDVASTEKGNEESDEKQENGNAADQNGAAKEEETQMDTTNSNEITVVDLENEAENGNENPKTDDEIVEKSENTKTEEKEVEVVQESVPETDKVVTPDETVQEESKDESILETAESTIEVENEAKEETKAEDMDSETSTTRQQPMSPVSQPIKSGPRDEGFYEEAQKLIVKFFLMPMPKDFFKFYDLCQELKPNDPSTAFSIIDIQLVGPYDVLLGLITDETPETKNFLTHWRYFYDPPEFQTILKGNDREGLHFGYWRDRPSSDPIFVASNSATVSHKIKPAAENIFGAVAGYLEERLKKANPFEKAGFNNLLTKVKNFAKKCDITLEAQTPKMKSREKTVVARTIHGAGITCPYNKKTQLGYRELSVTDNQLLKIVKKIEDAPNDDARAAPRSELAEVVRLATIAGDECDFGTCLELGHDLLSTGCTHVQNAALAMFTIAYEQLERRAFLKIAEAHLSKRKKGSKLSELSDTSQERIGLF
ncbi:hypothetical protein QAD02_011369 [Eretmocerus hayati]|uniref:Uncharacterized protein n=1 Tax=Eretmocerus hayati TaxID=131215 RepID=A0ACC2NXJ7_9HYME|nr:hypothetical protein QAD02_011369 [Eretmocerus hayati]